MIIIFNSSICIIHVLSECNTSKYFRISPQLMLVPQHCGHEFKPPTWVGIKKINNISKFMKRTYSKLKYKTCHAHVRLHVHDIVQRT